MGLVFGDSRRAGALTEIEFQLDAKADTSRKVKRGKARGMGIATPVDWMTDDERVFPVVIDPTYASASGGPVFDAFVQEGYTSDQSGAAELKLGDNGSGQVARSYLNFNASLFKDRTIISAELSLYESWSWSCTAKTFTSYDSGLASTSTRWTSQPTIGTKRASLSVAKGYNSSCPAGTVKLDMTAQAKAWSSTTESKVGMMLRASSETDSLYWKRFHSSEGTNKPVLKVTYNRVPNTPVAPTVAGIMTVDSKKFVGAARPSLSVVAKDPDADVLKVQFARFTSATSTSSPTTVCEKTSLASGGTATCTPTADLPANSKLWLRARVQDGREWSAWGAAVEVTTSRATPLAPTISCPSASGSWVIAVPTTKETCTITARYDSAQATSAPTQAQYRVNGGSWQTVSFTQITANKQVATVQAGGASGGHKVEAFVKSPTGKQSSTTAYSFGFGSPSLTTPNSTVITHGVVNMRAVGAPKGSAASVTGTMQWRLKGDTSWNDMPATISAGATETVATGAFDSEAILAANPTLPQRTSVVFEIRARFVYGGSSVISSNVRTVIRVPHAFGSGFPVADVEGGQVALWTGELQVTDSDADLTTPSGVSDMELADNTRYDGTLVLFDAEGSVLPFAPARGTPSRRSVRASVNIYAALHGSRCGRPEAAGAAGRGRDGRGQGLPGAVEADALVGAGDRRVQQLAGE